MRTSLWAVCVAGAATLAAGSLPANAYTVDPPGSIVLGQSIADWTQGWWTRYWQSPFADIDPATGNLPAGVNNNGPVFFAPTTDGNPARGHVTINFSVPFGRPLLVPMIPFDDLEAASIDPPTATLADRANAASIVVAGQVGSVILPSLFASIDGTAVSNPSSYLEMAGLFTSGPALAGSLANIAGVTVGDDLFPQKAGGYWLMIEGLSRGPHTLDYGGSSVQFTPDPNCCTNFPIGPFAVDVTANVFVAPEPTSGVLALTGLFGMFALKRKPERRRQAGIPRDW